MVSTTFGFPPVGREYPGYSLPTGGKPNVVETISAFDYFYSHWLRHAEDEKISQMKIYEFRAKLFLYASEMTKCSLKK